MAVRILESLSPCYLFFPETRITSRLSPVSSSVPCFLFVPCFLLIWTSSGDDFKAAENVRNHGVSFAQAALAFRDPFAVEWIDLREDYGEERIILLGMAGNHVLTVVYTERAERIRIISARQVTKNEQDLYYRQNAP